MEAFQDKGQNLQAPGELLFSTTKYPDQAAMNSVTQLWAMEPVTRPSAVLYSAHLTLTSRRGKAITASQTSGTMLSQQLHYYIMDAAAAAKSVQW